MNFNGFLPKIMAFIGIAITILLSPIIYTANLTVVNFVGASAFTALTSIAGFGGFLIILGLLISQGIFAFKQDANSDSKTNMFWSIGTVIGVVVLLNVFVAIILPAFTTLLAAAVAASDNLGESVFGFLPLIIYLGIVAGAAGGVELIKRAASKKKGGKKSNQQLAY